MSNISINYILLNSKDKDILQKMIDACRSDRHNVNLVFNDFSLDKKIEDNIKEIDHYDVNVSVINYDYEDSKNSMEIITKNFASYVDSDTVAIVYENLIFRSKILDEVDFEIITEGFNGFMYGDYHIDDIRFFLRSHSSGIQLNIPFVFWSVKKLIENMSKEKILEYIFNNFSGIHIAQSMCTIYTNEEE
jgi:hypothetical protein